MQIAINLLGGLGLFLYGMNLMAQGLQKSAGDKLKKIIELLTNNRVIGVLVGALVTAIIQSSSTTTVMVVGFVNAGIMNLAQAIGVIMGANIGTTITAQLISFNLDGLAPLSLGIGIIFYLFSKKQIYKNIAEILIGFGILFTGMEFMKDAVKPLAEYQGFKDALVSFSNQPILGVLAGFGLTVMVQSSSASMGILIALASQGFLPLASALPILYGENIGTCVTSLISSIGASINAKRAAIMHLCFNLIGTIIFMLILNRPIMSIVTYLDPNDTIRQIANTHTLFNIINVILLLPLANYIVKLAVKIIPDKQELDDDLLSTKYLDERMLETPSIALGNVVQDILRMGDIATHTLDSSMKGFLNKSEEHINKAFEHEVKVNAIQKDIINFLVLLSKSPLNDDERYKSDLFFHTVNDIERVSDLAENIAEIAKESKEKDIQYSLTAIDELKEMYDLSIDSFRQALIALKNQDIHAAKVVLNTENEIDNLEIYFRKQHLERLNDNACSIDSGIIFIELINTLERISDHASNIAKQVISFS